MLGMSDTRVARRALTIDDRIVTIRAGIDPSEDFAVHESILREHSSFFRRALDQKWKEGRIRHIDLPQDSSDVVGAYVHWLYFRTIASRPTSPPQLPIDDGEYLFLAQLYVVGERLQANDFCDDVIDAMASKSDDVAPDGTRTFPSYAAIMTLYNGTPPGSPARRFVVDIYVIFGTEEWIPEDAELSHSGFMADLVRAFMKRSHLSSSIYRQSNYLRRHDWHRCLWSREFLRPMSSSETVRDRDVE